jgi:hypothetical protein
MLQQHHGDDCDGNDNVNNPDQCFHVLLLLS